MGTNKNRGTKASFCKKIAAVFLTASLCVSLTACGDTSYAVQVDGEKIPAGIYLLGQADALVQAQSKEGFDTTLKDIWDNEVEGKSLEDWINASAKDRTVEYAQIEKMYKDGGFALTDTEKESIEYAMTTNWADNEATYSELGVSGESYKAYITNAIKKKAVFNSYYGDGGSEVVSDEVVFEHFKTDYAQVKQISFLTTDPTAPDAMTPEKKKEVEAKANVYLERAKKGEDMATLINEREKEVATETGAEQPEIDDTQTHLKTVKKDAQSYYTSEKLNKAIFEQTVPGGEPMLLTDDNGYYVVARYEITKESMDATTREALLADLKSEEFEKILTDLAKECEIELNNHALRAFKAEKMAKG